MTKPRRLEELLAERATQGLGGDGAAELETLLASHPEVDEDSYDLAAAAIDLALMPRIEPMPARVREAVLARARRELAANGTPGPVPAPVADFAAERARREPEGESTEAGSRSWTPWLAAAAALVLAVAGWWPRLAGAPGNGGVEVAVVDESPTSPAIEEAPDAIRWPWTGTEDPAVGEVGGEVVWSSTEQQGVMRIRGLAANDPSAEQYQLWIFDRAGDERYPVDGGVFDIPEGGVAEIPIDAKIEVDEPYLFAVTVEKPGGVVVSDRERIVILAQA